MKWNEIGEPQTHARIRVAKRINLFALSFLFLMLGLVFYLFLELRTNQRVLKSQQVELEEKNRRLNLMAEELAEFREREWEASQSQNARWNDLKQAADEENWEAVKDQLAALSQVKSMERAPDVAVYAVSPQAGLKDKLESALREAGYPVAFHVEPEERFSWLKTAPTILYPSATQADQARELKKLLDPLTGLTFALVEDKGMFTQQGGKGRMEVHLVDS